MCHSHNENLKKNCQIKKESERLEKRKIRKKLWNIGREHHQTNGDERKKWLKSTSDEREIFLKPGSAAEILSKY